MGRWAINTCDGIYNIGPECSLESNGWDYVHKLCTERHSTYDICENNIIRCQDQSEDHSQHRLRQ